MASAVLQRQICEALPDLSNDHATALYLCMRQNGITDSRHLKGLVPADFIGQSSLCEDARAALCALLRGPHDGARRPRVPGPSVCVQCRP